MTTLANYKFPGKTFVLGEYAVLEGATALLLATSPQFKSTVASKKSDEATHDFHEKSPAARWVNQFPEVFEGKRIHFEDPYQSIGGLGASGAQFLAAYSYYWDQCEGNASGKDFREQAWRDFKSLYNNEPCPPSGADVVTQASGGFVRFSQNPFEAKVSPWFAESEFAVLHTGAKLATHEHLNQLEAFDISELLEICKVVSDKMKEYEEAPKFNAQSFYKFLCEHINEYQRCLVSLGLQAEETTRYINSIRDQYSLDAVKGCGALGVDTLLLFYQKESGVDIGEICARYKLKLIAQKAQLAMMC